MAKAPAHQPKDDEPEKAKPVCGIIMPIAGMAGYDNGHWSEVRTIIDRAIVGAQMTPQPVWEGGVVDIIHDRIVSNLFENQVIVCDVSGLNPNVMLELGIRLSFAKPTIIITDDIGSLPFDTKIIEHLEYSRDLHILKTERFVEDLTSKLVEINAAQESNMYRPFIKNFGRIQPGSIGTERQPADLILDRLDRVSAELRSLRRDQSRSSSSYADAVVRPSSGGGVRSSYVTQTLHISVPAPVVADALTVLRSVYGVLSANLSAGSTDVVKVQLRPDVLWSAVEKELTTALGNKSVPYVVIRSGIEPVE